MRDFKKLEVKKEELARRIWKISAIKAKLIKLNQDGIPKKDINRADIINHKQEILENVQGRAEEYEYISHSCSKGTAIAVMEEFGLGNMEVVKAISPFPGFASMGHICGAVTGGFISLGLYFGSNNFLDYEGNSRTMDAAGKFMALFEREVGAFTCRRIQEEVIFGRYMDVRGSEENYENFLLEKGLEKCALISGIGAKLSAQIIIESMEIEDIA